MWPAAADGSDDKADEDEEVFEEQVVEHVRVSTALDAEAVEASMAAEPEKSHDRQDENSDGGEDGDEHVEEGAFGSPGTMATLSSATLNRSKRWKTRQRAAARQRKSERNESRQDLCALRRTSGRGARRDVQRRKTARVFGLRRCFAGRKEDNCGGTRSSCRRSETRGRSKPTRRLYLLRHTFDKVIDSLCDCFSILI